MGATHASSGSRYLMYSVAESVERFANRYWTTASYSALANALGLGMIAGLADVRRRRRK